MVLALLTAILASILCFIVTVYLGFVHSGTGITQHFLFGAFATFLVTLSQSMTMFYFIGTGKHVKDLLVNDARAQEFIQRTKRFKALSFPPALWAMLFTMATMIIGAGVHTKAIPWYVHLTLAVLALYYNCVAFWRDAKCMIAQNVLMEELVRYLDAEPTPAPAPAPAAK